jgi:hypothetical protein
MTQFLLLGVLGSILPIGADLGSSFTSWSDYEVKVVPSETACLNEVRLKRLRQEWFSTELVEFLAHDSLRRVMSPAERLSYSIDRLRRQTEMLDRQLEELRRTIEKLERKKKDNGGRD